MCCQKLPPTIVKRPGLGDADPEQPELRVRAADDDRRAVREPGLPPRPRRSPRRSTVPRSTTVGNDVRSSPTRSRARGPTSRAGEVEHPRARAERRVGDELAGEPGQDPVAEHPDVRDRREDVGLVPRDPEEAGGRGDRDPVARASRRSPGRAPLSISSVASSPARESTFGQAQISRPARVVEHHSLAHARRADRGDRARPLRPPRRAPRGCTRRSAPSCASVSKTCEPGTPGASAMAVLALADRHLVAVRVEEDGPAAARCRRRSRAAAASALTRRPRGG